MIKSDKLQSVTWFQLFCLLFVSRILISLTYIPSLNFQETNGDLLLSVLLMLPLLILFFLPVFFYMKAYRNENLSEAAHRLSKPVGVAVSGLYYLWFLFTGALNVTRFSYFVTSEMNEHASSFLLILLLIFAACYGAYLGIQSLGRVAAVIIWVMLVSFFFVMLFALKHFEITNFSPILKNKLPSNMMQAVSIACNTVEISVVPFIVPKVKEALRKKHFIIWSIGIVFLIFALYFVSIGTLGDFAQIQSYPIFTMSQISGVGILQRLDVIHTSIWIVSLFLKTAMFLVAATTALRGVIPKIKTPITFFITAILMSAVAWGISLSFPNYWRSSNQWVNIVPFLVFALAIPTVFAIIKRGKGDQMDEVSEKN